MSTPEKGPDLERMPVLVDVLMEGYAFGRAELAQETDAQRERYLLDSLLKRLRVPVEFGKIYQVKDRQHQRYAVHIPQAGRYFCGTSKSKICSCIA